MVWGPPGVIEGVAGGPSAKCEPNGPLQLFDFNKWHQTDGYGGPSEGVMGVSLKSLYIIIFRTTVLQNSLNTVLNLNDIFIYKMYRQVEM